MKNINATEFKSGCLALLDEIARTGEPITVTKRGKPVVQVVPIREATRRYPQDTLHGTVQTLGDIVSPALESSDWEAERRPG